MNTVTDLKPEHEQVNISALDFIVVNTRTRNPIGAFMLPADALQFIQHKRTLEGPQGALYEIRNLDRSPISTHLQAQVSIVNRGLALTSARF